jgi:hypothetical protein
MDPFGQRTKVVTTVTTIRLGQLQAQGKAIRSRRARLPALATYQSRDPITGDRVMRLPDGGVTRQSWISNTTPSAIPPLTVVTSTIGLPGYSSQKPR